MIANGYEEIFSSFEEISSSYKRKNQYFDILYDSTSSFRIMKTRSAETISVNSKTSGIVARTFIGNWRELALKDIAELKTIEKKFPKVHNKGGEIKEFEGWKINKEIKPKIDPSEIPIEEKLYKIREIFEYIKNYDKRIINPIILKEKTNISIFDIILPLPLES